ncbi:DUF1080 domain-containing protein, partial [Verrucomicrobia bacterium]|nr:DUF1080 domain-containing protein [Verrucomicrobiota bacterium]
ERILFNGKNLDAFELAPGSWEIEKDGSVVCRMEKTKDKKGKERIRGMGYLWTKEDFSDFELSLEYKLSAGANSGIFYRSDKNDPVHGGFEIQLMDNEGFQKKANKVLPPRKLNASFYDGVAPKGDFSKPVGQWNQSRLVCKGSKVSFHLNGKLAFNINLDNWKEAGKNPDGSANKFKVALRDLSGKGRIGFQNHGQVVWFRKISIKSL